MTDFLVLTDAGACAGAGSMELDGPNHVAVDPPCVDVSSAGILQHLLAGHDYNILNPMDGLYDEYPVVYDGGMHGPWVTRLSGKLVSGLARLDPRRVKVVARRWAGECDFFDEEEPATARRLAAKAITDPIGLAKRAESQGRNMYILIC